MPVSAKFQGNFRDEILHRRKDVNMKFLASGVRTLLSEMLSKRTVVPLFPPCLALWLFFVMQVIPFCKQQQL